MAGVCVWYVYKHKTQDTCVHTANMCAPVLPPRSIPQNPICHVRPVCERQRERERRSTGRVRAARFTALPPTPPEHPSLCRPNFPTPSAATPLRPTLRLQPHKLTQKRSISRELSSTPWHSVHHNTARRQPPNAPRQRPPTYRHGQKCNLITCALG